MILESEERGVEREKEEGREAGRERQRGERDID